MVEFCGEENMEPFGDNKFRAYCPFIEDDFWYSMLLRLGDKCECLEPEHVRSEVIRRVEKLLAIYKKS
jgi:predicted DNA-binding transcriptional regulator YafY